MSPNPDIDLLRHWPHEQFCDFVGTSPAMRRVYSILEKVAPSAAPVLIGGESGTGKELAMLALRSLGPRAKRPLAIVNCAAIPEHLLESELFGHARGSFTGATGERQGAFVEAHHGTLFLDEIGELPLLAQAKLLRTLQTGEVKRIGENHATQVDVRIVAATHRDLRSEVQAGRFREDLYYRLHVIGVELPALRERGSDICLIATTMLRRYAKEEGKVFESFSDRALATLMQYPWPGNVRELINAIRATVVLHDGRVVEVHMLPDRVRDAVRSGLAGADLALANHFNSPAADTAAKDPAAVKSLAQLEQAAISEALVVFRGNVRSAALALGINVSTLYRKLQLRSAYTP
jgi:two-component system repressor protein LuxO